MIDYKVGDVVRLKDVHQNKPPGFKWAHEINQRGLFIVRNLINAAEQVGLVHLDTGLDINRWLYSWRFEKDEFMTAARNAVLAEKIDV